VRQECLGIRSSSFSKSPSGKKLREEADDDNYLESIEKVELEVEDLANFISKKLDIELSSSDDEADS
jgi:hypothetical protein